MGEKEIFNPQMICDRVNEIPGNNIEVLTVLMDRVKSGDSEEDFMALWSHMTVGMMEIIGRDGTIAWIKALKWTEGRGLLLN